MSIINLEELLERTKELPLVKDYPYFDIYDSKTWGLVDFSQSYERLKRIKEEEKWRAMELKTKEALEKIRAGKGPILIEAYTFRISDHTTADDAKKYRDPAEVERWKPKDPILRLKKYILSEKIATEADLAKIDEIAKKNVNEAVHRSEKIVPPVPTDMFQYAWGKKPWNVIEEEEQFKREHK